jgi:hypothetical protein
MTPNRHRIQRQVVELSLGGGLASPAVQASLAHAFRGELVPELTAVFDRAADADHLLRLDRLEIDLGTIAASDWQSEFRRRLGIELAQQLAFYVPESTTADSQLRPGVRSSEPQRQFLFFLEHGRIPWWGERPASGWNESLPPEILDWPALRATLRANTRARIRLIDSLNDALLELAIAKWGGVPHAAGAIQWLARRLGLAQAGGEWRRRAWRRLLDTALEPGALLARGPGLFQELFGLSASSATGTAVASWSGAEKGAASHGDGPHESEPSLDLPPPWRDWLSGAQHDVPAQRAPQEIPATRPGDAGPVARTVRSGDRRGEPTALATEDESIYLPGAGVVVLHPFLEPLFRDRGLLEGRQFRDETSRQRAIRLVGLLSFGSREVPEYDLVAAKLLCGLRLEEPLVPLALDDADATACDELIAAVLGHWSALRSSSAGWLRLQFFLRDGKLERVDEGFRLTVERRAQDVLLARLPWGIGVIGFPWMKDKVFVRWLD